MNRFRPLLLLALAWSLIATGYAAPTVVLDAGHGGHDRGGIPGQRASEKALCLSITRQVASKLRAAGYRVALTRSDDTFIPLSQRVAIANRQGSAIFLSIHFNAAPRVGANGVETYYYSGRSAGFAAAVHRETLRAMGTDNRGVRRRGFFVIRKTRCPSVLVEPAFLTNPDDVRRLATASGQDRLASALARAIISRY